MNNPNPEYANRGNREQVVSGEVTFNPSPNKQTVITNSDDNNR